MGGCTGKDSKDVKSRTEGALRLAVCRVMSLSGGTSDRMAAQRQAKDDGAGDQA